MDISLENFDNKTINLLPSLKTIGTIFGFVLLLLLLRFALKNEWYDIKCPEGPDTKNMKKCAEGNGKNYHGSKPSEKDKTEVLLSKINIAATSIRKDIVWRKAVIYACLSSIFIFSVALQIIPTVSQLFLTCLMIMLVIYFGTNYFNHHHYAHVEKNIIDSVNILKERNRS